MERRLGFEPRIVKIEDINETKEVVTKTIQDVMYDRYFKKLTSAISEPEANLGVKIRVQVNYDRIEFGDNNEQPNKIMLQTIAGHILDKINEKSIDNEKIDVSFELNTENNIRYIDFVVTENRQIS